MKTGEYLLVHADQEGELWPLTNTNGTIRTFGSGYLGIGNAESLRKRISSPYTGEKYYSLARVIRPEEVESYESDDIPCGTLPTGDTIAVFV